MLAPRLRFADASDAETLGRIHVRAWRETYAGLLPPDVIDAQTIESRTAMWRHILSSPPAQAAFVLVAELDGETVGFAACGAQRTAPLARSGFDAEITAIYVLRASQGQRIGTALMRSMASALCHRAHRAASLWVARENAVARRFYERLGGEEIAQKDEPRSGTVLVEIGYGWRDLRRLAAATIPPPGADFDLAVM